MLHTMTPYHIISEYKAQRRGQLDIFSSFISGSLNTTYLGIFMLSDATPLLIT